VFALVTELGLALVAPTEEAIEYVGGRVAKCRRYFIEADVFVTDASLPIFWLTALTQSM
jgi:hypothetical protein